MPVKLASDNTITGEKLLYDARLISTSEQLPELTQKVIRGHRCE